MSVSSTKRQLFLSWMAVREALLTGNVQEADLKDCLFSTSVGELILGQCLDRGIFIRVFDHLLAAAKDGRLVYFDKIEQANGCTVGQVNGMLQQNGVAPVQGLPESASAMLVAGVNRSDLAVEAHYKAQPRPDEMCDLLQRQQQADSSLLAAGRKLEQPSLDWMQQLPMAIAQKG